MTGVWLGSFRLDPRTNMGLLLALTLVSFVGKPPWLEVGFVLALAFLQLLCGYGRMAVSFVVAFALLAWVLDHAFALLAWVLDHAFAAGAVAFLSSLTYILTLVRRVFGVLMVSSLLAADNSAHRITAALRHLRVSETVLVPLATALRYFPTLVEEIGHIRDVLRLRDVTLSERIEAHVVLLMVSATNTADELSRAAVCRGIENPARRPDTERLRMGALDWAVLALAVVACALACGGAHT